MKKLILKPYDKIIVALLGIIGFLTGCSIINPPVAEYGVPTADYEIKGTVTDSITSTPIENAKVLITRTQTYLDQNIAKTYTDTLAIKETDNTGKYDITVQGFPQEEVGFQVKIEDIDGTANGGDFNSQQKSIVFKNTDLTSGKTGWYSGKAVKTQDFKLKKK